MRLPIELFGIPFEVECSIDDDGDYELTKLFCEDVDVTVITLSDEITEKVIEAVNKKDLYGKDLRTEAFEHAAEKGYEDDLFRE